MSADAPGGEEEFSRLLAAGDDALAAGAPPAGPETSAELRPRLERELSWCRLVRRLWPHTRPVPAWPPPLTRLGRFEVRRELGRGGFGVVFLAYDPQLRREVALKLPRPETLVTPALRQRFQQEARAAACLDHPNLVPVYEAGEEGAVCYIVSAYCPGITLAAWLKERDAPLPGRDAAALIATLADAVQHAHSRNVLHRDLKPANILLAVVSCQLSVVREERHTPSPLTTDNRQLTTTPKITDFGLAKLLEEGPGGSSAGPTHTGAVLGTPAYMAPEQAAGHGKSVGPAADVYALGAILYELLTGRPPFRGETPLDVLQQVQSAEPVPPGRLQPGVPRDLETICGKCLQKEPRRRYASAAALADDLRRFLAGEPIRARPVPHWERALKWSRRRPALVGLLAVSAAALMALLGGVLWHTSHLQRALETADSLRADALREQLRAEEREQQVRHYLHAANLNLAQEFWRRAELGPMRDLLARDAAAGGRPDFTGRYLWRLCHSERRILAGPTADVYCVTFAPDGRTVAATSRDSTVTLWDAETGAARRVLRGHTDEANGLAFSPDGRTLATAGDDRTVRLWDVATGLERATLRGHVKGVLCVAFAPSGNLLASAGDDAVVRLWDPATGEARAVLAGHTAAVESLAFSPDGRTLATTGRDRHVRLWDAAAGTLRAVVAPHAETVHALAFSHDGRTLATGCADCTVRLWNSADGQEICALRGHTDAVQCVTFSPDDRTLASAAQDATVRLWDVARRQVRGVVKGHAERVWGVAFAPDGRTLATAGRDRTVRLWDAGPDQEHESLPDGGPRPSCAALTGGRLAVGNRDGGVRIWDLATRRRLSRLPDRPDETLYSLALAPDGRTLVTASIAGMVRSWDVDSGRQKRAWPGPNNFLPFVFFPPDGGLWVVRAGDGLATVWDAAADRELARLPAPAVTTLSAALAPDGRQLALGGDDGIVYLWERATGRRQSLVAGHRGDVHGLAFSPDGRLLATCGNDPTAKLWNLPTGRERLRLLGHAKLVNAVAFAPDGQTVATAGDDQTVRLWDAATGQELAVLLGHTGPVLALAFAADGTLLASTGLARDGPAEVYLWRADAGR